MYSILQVSKLFGGLGICSLEAVVAKDDKEYIIEVNDCATSLLGESQEDDRKNIADLVLKTMEVRKHFDTFLGPSSLPVRNPSGSIKMSH